MFDILGRFSFLQMASFAIFQTFNLKSAILADSWLKTALAPQQQHQEEPWPRYPHPPLPPLPLAPTTTSMSPKFGDLVASAPLLSPFPPPWRWELATCTFLLYHTHPFPVSPSEEWLFRSSFFQIFIFSHFLSMQDSIVSAFPSFRRWTDIGIWQSSISFFSTSLIHYLSFFRSTLSLHPWNL